MQLPEYHHHQEFINRTQKLNELRESGVEPFPHSFKPTHLAVQILLKYQDQEIGHSEEAAEGKTDEVIVAGRLVLFRAMGKNAFAHIQDSSERIQVMFNRDLTKIEGVDANGEAVKWIEKKIDLGDIIGIQGNVFRTQKGEITIYAKKLTVLCKTLLPLPDKHSGLADKEVRYRKRWLDLITHPEVRNTFYMRSRIFTIIRRYFEQAHFVEVETPVLQNLYGGAEARPFTSHLNALDQEMYLRISLEISLKKLVVGGMERIFEIGKVFRNEGIDKTHNPEFTMLEAYAAYWDYNDMMEFTENLLETIAMQLFGSTKIRCGETPETSVEIDLKAPWPRLSMKECVKKFADIDVDHETDASLRKILKDRTEVDPKLIDASSHGLLVALLFDEFATKELIQPHHIIDHPIETTPLCKPHREKKLRDQGLVERFESYILGKELCNAYTELNDPEIQRQLLVDQGAKRDAGNEEAHPLDEEFIEAICQGMPPTGGVGIGLDRLVMIFTNASSIRDVLYFPVMKPTQQ